MVAFGRLAVTGRLFLAVLTIYLVYVAISLLLPWEGPPHTQKHLQEDIAAVVNKVEGCEGEACLNVKVEREENARLKEENAKLVDKITKLKEVVPDVPWISTNTDVRLWIGMILLFFHIFIETYFCVYLVTPNYFVIMQCFKT